MISYADWLRMQVSEEKYTHGVDYSTVIDVLEQTPFIPDGTVSMDVNRCESYATLYSFYTEDTGVGVNYEYRDSSVFEVFCALAIHINNSILGDERRGMTRWFLMFLDNIGVSPYDDEGTISEMVTRWMNHEYSPTGEGSLFGDISSLTNDARKVDIWFQMQFWARLNRPWDNDEEFLSPIGGY